MSPLTCAENLRRIELLVNVTTILQLHWEIVASLRARARGEFWQRSQTAFQECCEHLRHSPCCHEGTLRPNCVQDVDGPCPDGESHGY